MKALCGLDFTKTTPSEDDMQRVEKELKIPVLNNVALCLMKMEKYVKANQMID